MNGRDHETDNDNAKPERCGVCGAEQEQFRSAREYMVELKPIAFRGYKVLACTDCIHKLELERKRTSTGPEKISPKDSNIHLEKLAEILKRLSERYTE